jgi:phosphohistidine phosphatase
VVSDRPPERSAQIALVHHAEAVGPEVDPARPLSAHGRAQAERLALRAREHGVKPVVIWHSGKLRARQTAEWFLRLCNPLAAFKMAAGLRPDDSPVHAADWLRAADEDVLIVSHWPVLPAIARLLAPSMPAFPMNGLVLMERVGDGTYAETWRASP